EHVVREVEAHRKVAERAAQVASESPVADAGDASKDRFAFFVDELDRKDDEDDPHREWRHEAQRRRHELNAGATGAELAEVQEKLGIPLPPSFREFSERWGGGRLFTQEWRELRLVGATEIHVELKKRLVDRMRRPFLPLVDLGDGDYLVFD